MMPKRAGAVLYAGVDDHLSHRIRLVVAEKQVLVELVLVEPGVYPEDLSSLNPYNSLPTLVDRDLCLYETRIIMDYLEERYPQPPLLPLGPAARAQVRQYVARIDREWTPLITRIIQSPEPAIVSAARKALRDHLITISPIFLEKPYFMSDELTQADCVMAPILWRLKALGIELPDRPCRGLFRYRDRLFSRPAFQASLTDAERLHAVRR